MSSDSDITAQDPDAGMAPPPPPPPPPVRPRLPRRRIIGGRAATAAVAGGLVVGGITGGYVLTHAATTPTPGATPGVATPCSHGHHGGAAAFRQDLEQTAGVIGISVTQLETELEGGKTIAAVAAEHHVAAATVVNALVAAESSEVDQRVASGRITAAQGAAEKAETTQRVTDEVNGTRPDGGFGRWGAGAHGPGGGSAPTS